MFVRLQEILTIEVWPVPLEIVPPLAFCTSLGSLLNASWWLLHRVLWRGISFFHLEWGGSSGVTLEVASDGDEGSAQSSKWCHHLDQGKGPVAAGAVEGGVHGADSHSRGDTPGGMLNRVDIGAFLSNRW